MKILAIDLETTGLDFDNCQILSIGAVIDNGTDKPLQTYYKQVVHDTYHGEIYALNLNKQLLTDILENKDGNNIHIDNLVDDFKNWLYQHYKEDEKITVCGKNYSGFDKRFLEKLEGWNTIKFSHRVIDPSILYMDWDNDESLPNLDECLKRANINKTVSHNALDDAMDIVNLLRVYRGSR